MVYHNPIVIGSGIIGSSVVYHLSRLKYAVKWFDPMPHGWFSTSRAAGLILHGSQKNAPISLFAHQTIRDIHNLETQLDENIGFNQCGSLSFHKNKYPINTHSIDISPFQTTYLPPNIYYQEADGFVDPIVLAGAYKRATPNCSLLPQSVDALLMEQNKVIGVKSNGEDFIGDVIDCTGSWLGDLAIQQNIISHKPYLPVRSHYYHCKYGSHTKEIPALLMQGLYIRHNNNNNYIIGIREKESYFYDKSLPNNEEALKYIKTDDRDAILIENYDMLGKIFPNLDELQITDYTAGFSNYTPDGHYLIGKICDGLYWAGGDCGSGISSAGGIGRMIAEKKCMQALDPLRFKNIGEERLITDILASRANKC